MSENLKKYDPKAVTLTWTQASTGLTINVNRGIVDGTFFTVARNVVLNSLRVGGDGDATTIMNRNQSGLVGSTLRRGSGTNAQLSAILNAYENTGFGGVGVLTMKDFSGASLYVSQSAVIEGYPEGSFSDSTEDDLVWNFLCHRLQIFHGGSSDAT